MTSITVHCTRCGEAFSAPYIIADRWHYHCPKCRDGVMPDKILEEETTGDDDE